MTCGTRGCTGVQRGVREGQLRTQLIMHVPTLEVVHGLDATQEAVMQLPAWEEWQPQIATCEEDVLGGGSVWASREVDRRHWAQQR